MKIVFVRHGQPEFNTRIRVGNSNGDIRATLQQYHDAGVKCVPPYTKAMIAAEPGAYVLVSELLRAQDSARLCVDSELEVSKLLNEADLPHPDTLLLPLPWSVLLTVCRLGWLIGYRSNAPGIRCDLYRAKQAAALLVDRTSEHDNVYVFGHAIMSRLIIRQLKKKGWSVQSSTGSGYWSSAIVSLE